ILSPRDLVLGLGQSFVLSICFLAVAILVAGRKTTRSWQQVAPSRTQSWLLRTFCTPKLWLSVFERWMRRKLERNPVGWLEQRTWSGRLVMWGWLAVAISLTSAALTDRNFSRSYRNMQVLLGWL